MGCGDREGYRCVPDSSDGVENWLTDVCEGARLDYLMVSYSEYGKVCLWLVSMRPHLTMTEVKIFIKILNKRKFVIFHKTSINFSCNFKKICHITYKNKTKNMCNQWRTLPSEMMVVQMTI